METFQEKLANWLNEYSFNDAYVFKSFTQYLRESPQWDNSDCTFGQEELQKMMGNEEFLDEFRWSGVQDYRAIVNKGDKESNKFIIITDDKSKVFLGHCDGGMFKVLSILTHAQPKAYPIIGTVTEVKTVNTHSKFRNRGFASAIYKSMMFEGTKLMSDAVQYKGAVVLWKDFFITPDEGEEWKRMIDDKDIIVSLYDILEKKVILKDLKSIEDLTDSQIWSDDSSKTHLRLIAEIE